MADSGKEGPPEQHNHGPGPLIGRDNYGDIRYEMFDPKTKTALAKLSKDAPGLAKLLTQALHDGIISPDVVAALESAVRNINEDVAGRMIAGKNINEESPNRSGLQARISTRTSQITFCGPPRR